MNREQYGGRNIYITFFLLLTLAACSGKRGQHSGNMADTTQLDVLLERADYYFNKPGGVKEDIDSAIYTAGEMEQIGIRLQYKRALGLSKLTLARAWRASGRSAEARSISEEAVVLLQRSGRANEKADALIDLGASYSNAPAEIDKKIRLYEQGTQFYHELGDVQKEAELKEFIGDLYHVKRDFEHSLTYLKESLALYQKNGHDRLQGIYGLLSIVYAQTDNFVESLRYGLLAVKTGEAMKDSSMLMANNYYRLATTYQLISQESRALEYQRKALHITRQLRDTFATQAYLVEMGRVFTRMKDFPQALDTLNAAVALYPRLDPYDASIINILKLAVYTELNRSDSAAKTYDRLKYLYDSDQIAGIMKQSVAMALSGYLVRMHKYLPARVLLNSVAASTNKLRVTLPRRSNMELLYFQIDSAAGRYTEAIKHFREHKILSDSLQDLGKTEQLAELQLRYETEKKDNDIKLLAQKSQVQETLLLKEKVIRNLIIAVTIILIIFLVFVYSRYQHKKTTTVRLEGQQKEINKQNTSLKRLVDEKEWLLKEIHHRVKNNLQIIISLLNTQSQYLNNQDAIEAIRNSRQRMYSMSLIHQRLYQTDHPDRIDMYWYLPELISYMKDGFETRDRIQFRVECDHVELDVMQAVPLGLILNEAISNALKYAFPDGKRGTITVRLKMEDDTCTLHISDNGVGISDTDKLTQTGSLGMSLMYGLADQLDGNFDISDNAPGVSITLTFPYHELAIEGAVQTDVTA